MRAINSKLNMYVQSVSIINNNFKRLLLHIIFWSFGALAIFYVLFLGNMVRDIIERRSLEARVRTLSGEVRDLELAYLSMSSGVDLTLSYSLGFRETKTTFATRKSLGLRSTNEPFGNIKIAQNDL
ncbi:MAG: hypothetical protein Q7K11_01390 [Candidatus Berkelbacteria bacterium]|nr:hypothetical protein [Candidatus Berkelbacteria bacterium]